MSNVQKLIPNNGILNITRSYSPGLSSRSSITVKISESYFYYNGFLLDDVDNRLDTFPSTVSININDTSVLNCNVILNKTKFISNINPVLVSVTVFKLMSTSFVDILLVNNSMCCFPTYSESANINVFGFHSSDMHMAFSIMSSNFIDNYGNIVSFNSVGNEASIMFDNSNFINSKLAVNAINVIDINLLISTKSVSSIIFNDV